MKSDKILDYLRYLRKKVDDLQSTFPLGVEHILPLQSELRLFRDRMTEDTTLSAKVREFLRAADLKIDPVHLAGSPEHRRQTWWMHFPWLKSFLMHRYTKDREIVGARLAKLRDYLYELYCLVEVSTQKPNQPPEPTAPSGRGSLEH